MRSGSLRCRLIIESPNEAQDNLGQEIQTWALFAEVFGSLDPISGRERVLSAQTMAEATYRARIRFLRGLTTKMRIKYGERIYHIVYIADDSRGRELVLDLIEGVIDA